MAQIVKGIRYKFNNRKHAVVWEDKSNLRAWILKLANIDEDYGSGWKELKRYKDVKLMAVEHHLSKETINLYNWFANKYL